jgi:hypothetical protein
MADIIAFPDLPGGVSLAMVNRLITHKLLRPEQRHDPVAIRIAMNEALMRIMLQASPEGTTPAEVVERMLEALLHLGGGKDPDAA